jgi:hypothetical protein
VTWRRRLADLLIEVVGWVDEPDDSEPRDVDDLMRGVFNDGAAVQREADAAADVERLKTAMAGMPLAYALASAKPRCGTCGSLVMGGTMPPLSDPNAVLDIVIGCPNPKCCETAERFILDEPVDLATG